MRTCVVVGRHDTRFAKSTSTSGVTDSMYETCKRRQVEKKSTAEGGAMGEIHERNNHDSLQVQEGHELKGRYYKLKHSICIMKEKLP